MLRAEFGNVKVYDHEIVVRGTHFAFVAGSGHVTMTGETVHAADLSALAMAIAFIAGATK